MCVQLDVFSGIYQHFVVGEGGQRQLVGTEAAVGQRG